MVVPYMTAALKPFNAEAAVAAALLKPYERTVARLYSAFTASCTPPNRHRENHLDVVSLVMRSSHRTFAWSNTPHGRTA